MQGRKAMLFNTLIKRCFFSNLKCFTGPMPFPKLDSIGLSRQPCFGSAWQCLAGPQWDDIFENMSVEEDSKIHEKLTIPQALLEKR
jgi:hypothetical protein